MAEYRGGRPWGKAAVGLLAGEISSLTIGRGIFSFFGPKKERQCRYPSAAADKKKLDFLYWARLHAVAVSRMESRARSLSGVLWPCRGLLGAGGSTVYDIIMHVFLSLIGVRLQHRLETSRGCSWIAAEELE